MGTSTAKKMVLGATVGLVTVMAMLAPASARGRHHHHHFRHWHGPVVVTSDYDGCDYLRWKWQHTGSGYWKSRYFACMS